MSDRVAGLREVLLIGFCACHLSLSAVLTAGINR